MRKMISLCLGICIVPFTGSSQTNTTQLPNGVVVHQAEGVEGTPEKKSDQPVIRTMETWTLAECMDMLPYLESKISTATEEDKQRYLAQKVALDKRIAELKSGK